MRSATSLWRCALLIATLWLGAPQPAHAQFELSSAAVFAGTPVTVSLPEGVDTLLITYRPNTPLSHRHVLRTEGAEQVQWTPADAGIVALSAPGLGSQNVSVRFRSLPASGLFVLIVAGTILFGGAIFAMYHLFISQPPHVDPATRPDT